MEYGHTELATLLEVGSGARAEPAARASPGGAPEPSEFDVEELDEVHILVREASLRRKPTFAAPVAAQLPQGVQLRVTGRVVGRPWYRVGPAERAVYIESEALLPSTP